MESLSSALKCNKTLYCLTARPSEQQPHNKVSRGGRGAVYSVSISECGMELLL